MRSRLVFQCFFVPWEIEGDSCFFEFPSFLFLFLDQFRYVFGQSLWSFLAVESLSVDQLEWNVLELPLGVFEYSLSQLLDWVADHCLPVHDVPVHCLGSDQRHFLELELNKSIAFASSSLFEIKSNGAESFGKSINSQRDKETKKKHEKLDNDDVNSRGKPNPMPHGI